MKLVKWVGVLLCIVLVIGGGAAYYLASNLDEIVKDMVEKTGSEVTKTQVTVEAVKIDLLTGKGQITGLTIANPPGFNSDYVFRLENVILGLDINSLTGPVIVISQVTIDGAKLVAEQKGTTTNLSELKKNLDASASNTDSEASPDSADSSSSDIRLMMEHFSLTKTQGTIVTQQWGEQSLVLPDVIRDNIGNKKTGLTAEQLSSELLLSIIGQVEKATQGYLAKLAQDELSKRLKEELKTKLKVDDGAVDGALKSLFNKFK